MEETDFLLGVFGGAENGLRPSRLFLLAFFFLILFFCFVFGFLVKRRGMGEWGKIAIIVNVMLCPEYFCLVCGCKFGGGGPQVIRWAADVGVGR